DERVEARRVDLVDRRREDEVEALVLADREVAGLVAGVLLEVGRLVELARVDEDRRDPRRVVGPGPLHQRAVAVVDPAHRRHQADRTGGGGEGIPKLGSGPDDAHRGRGYRIPGTTE